MSIAELARAAELTESTIYRLEAEGRKPRSDTLQALAEALNVSADDILGLDQSSPEPVEAAGLALTNLPLLLSPSGEARTMIVPEAALPESISRDRLVVILPDDAAPDVTPRDTVIVARDEAWEDGDLLAAVLDDAYVIRRAYAEADGQILLVGSDMSVRRRVSAESIVGRAMTAIRHL